MRSVAYSYQRFSKPEQARGDSIRRQTELAESWCSRNGVALADESTIRDAGVSGYSGANRGDKAALGAFLALAKSGRVAKGSYLLVESLDRLSREDAVPALSLLLDLIQSGIRVVQLLPSEYVFDERANPMALMLAIAELSRGHSESRMKSERCSRAWSEKKRLAAAKKVPITKIVPAWIEVRESKFSLRPEAAAVVRRIYRLARDGRGIEQIARLLNAESVPAISGKSAKWGVSYVASILKNRAVFGEYQPMRGKTGNRKPDGSAVPGYFPAVLSEDQWLATRREIESRRRDTGRPTASVNVFRRLVVDPRTGTPMRIMSRGKSPVIYPASYANEGTPLTSFPLSAFEAAVFCCLSEVDPGEVIPALDDGQAGRIEVIQARILALDARAEQMKSRMSDPDSAEDLADVLGRIRSERKRLALELADLRAAVASPLADAWSNGRGLIESLQRKPGCEELRLKLRSVVRRIVSRVYCLVVPRGDVRLAAVQIEFTESKANRCYFVAFRPEKVIGSGKGRFRRNSKIVIRSFPKSVVARGKLRPAAEAELNRLDVKAIFEDHAANSSYSFTQTAKPLGRTTRN
jgi:DNA invertase Pin-like site-specific DNA recombinase